MPPMKTVMNAVRILKKKKTAITAQKSFNENAVLNQTLKRSQTLDSLMKQNTNSAQVEILNRPATFNELQKAIFNNDYKWIIVNSSKIQPDILNKLNLE